MVCYMTVHAGGTNIEPHGMGMHPWHNAAKKLFTRSSSAHGCVQPSTLGCTALLGLKTPSNDHPQVARRNITGSCAQGAGERVNFVLVDILEFWWCVAWREGGLHFGCDVWRLFMFSS